MSESKSWTRAQAAKYLKISPDTLGILAAAGKIPGTKIGSGCRGIWVFSPTLLAEYLQCLDVPQAAKILGKSEQIVRELARGGVLPARKLGRRWLFSEVYFRGGGGNG